MAYQGIMAINKRLLKNGYHELNHIVALKDLSKRLCLDETVVHKYFRTWCTPVDVGVGNYCKRCKNVKLTGIAQPLLAKVMQRNYRKLMKN